MSSKQQKRVESHKSKLEKQVENACLLFRDLGYTKDYLYDALKLCNNDAQCIENKLNELALEAVESSGWTKVNAKTKKIDSAKLLTSNKPSRFNSSQNTTLKRGNAKVIPKKVVVKLSETKKGQEESIAPKTSATETSEFINTTKVSKEQAMSTPRSTRKSAQACRVSETMSANVSELSSTNLSNEDAFHSKKASSTPKNYSQIARQSFRRNRKDLKSMPAENANNVEQPSSTKNVQTGTLKSVNSWAQRIRQSSAKPSNDTHIAEKQIDNTVTSVPNCEPTAEMQCCEHQAELAQVIVLEKVELPTRSSAVNNACQQQESMPSELRAQRNASNYAQNDVMQRRMISSNTCNDIESGTYLAQGVPTKAMQNSDYCMRCFDPPMLMKRLDVRTEAVSSTDTSSVEQTLQQNPQAHFSKPEYKYQELKHNVGQQMSFFNRNEECSRNPVCDPSYMLYSQERGYYSHLVPNMPVEQEAMQRPCMNSNYNCCKYYQVSHGQQGVFNVPIHDPHSFSQYRDPTNVEMTRMPEEQTHRMYMANDCYMMRQVHPTSNYNHSVLERSDGYEQKYEPSYIMHASDDYQRQGDNSYRQIYMKPQADMYYHHNIDQDYASRFAKIHPTHYGSHPSQMHPSGSYINEPYNQCQTRNIQKHN